MRVNWKEGQLENRSRNFEWLSMENFHDRIKTLALEYISRICRLVVAPAGNNLSTPFRVRNAVQSLGHTYLFSSDGKFLRHLRPLKPRML